MKAKFCAVLTFALGISAISGARNESSWHWSFESNDPVYTDRNSYGSNNYLKIDWSAGRFRTGLQAEWYPRPLLGYDEGLKGVSLPGKFISYVSDRFHLTLGDWYDQFGTGLLFRSWEDRTLGMNNAIGGARAEYASDRFAARLVWGFPKHLRGYSATQILGTEVTLMPIPVSGGALGMRMSFLERFEKSLPYYLEKDWTKVEVPVSNASWSLGADYSSGAHYIKLEYCGKQRDWHDFTAGSVESLAPGKAFYAESGLYAGDFSAAASFRHLDNMSNKAFRTDRTFISNTLNYIPALSLQHTYMLCTLEPYYPNSDGENAWQLDLLYNTGRKGRLHLNYSEAHCLGKYHALGKNALLFRDISLRYERKWNRRLKSVLLLNVQESSPSRGVHRMTQVRNTAVADLSWRASERFSMRGELQYLYSAEGEKDWCAALLEASLTSGWSFFAKDMYNHGSSGIHYWQGGLSYSKGHYRIGAAFGRNREGMVCSGGVCRWQPGFTGGNLSLSIIF